MTIESTVVSAVESKAASTAEGALDSVAGGLLSQFNPLSYVKWAGYAAGAAAALFLGYRIVSFVEQAQADHAAVATLTTQRDQAVQTANDNAAALVASNRQHAAAVAGAEAAKAAALAQSADLKKSLEALSHAPHTSSGCLPSAAASAVLDRLRQ